MALGDSELTTGAFAKLPHPNGAAPLKRIHDSDFGSGAYIEDVVLYWSGDMSFRPKDLASRMAARQTDGYVWESFSLPGEEARANRPST